MSDRNLVFCMDVGGTRTKYGLIDLVKREIMAQQVLPTITIGQVEFIRAARTALFDLCQQIGISWKEIAAGGVGVPGYVDGDLISMVWESLSFMEGTAFKSGMEKEFGFRLCIDNDARLVALGEAHFGGHTISADRLHNPSRLLSLTLGTGLGVSLVVNGQLQENCSITHLAGHIPIRPGTSPCFCGFSGCLESLVGTATLARNYQKANHTPSISEHPQINGLEIFQMAAEGKAPAIQAVHLLCQDLVTGLNAYIHLYGPDVIVLGGGLAYGLRDWLPLIRDGIFAKPYRGYRVNVVVSTLGELAGLFGAASFWDDG